MNIYLIRHAKVNMKWPNKCNSLEFDEACKQYDLAEIVEVNKIEKVIDYKKIYVSNMYRSIKTAQGLFPGNKYTKINVEEVPLKSYRDSTLRIPLWIWNVIGRLQWYFNNNRQDETRDETINRCMQIIKELESKNENCVIITHGFFLKTFIKCLKKHGFSIKGNKNMKVSNLQLIVAEKR